MPHCPICHKFLKTTKAIQSKAHIQSHFHQKQLFLTSNSGNSLLNNKTFHEKSWNQYMMNQNFPLFEDKNEAYLWLAGHGKTEDLRYFIEEERVDPFFKFHAAVRIAAKKGKIENMKYLVAKHLLLEKYNGLALTYAIKYHHYKTANFILQQAKNNIKLRYIYLKAVVKSRNLKYFKKIISEFGLDVNCNPEKQRYNSKDILGLAIQMQCLEAVQFVISEGYRYNAGSGKNYTNFYQLNRYRSSEIDNYLLKELPLNYFYTSPYELLGFLGRLHIEQIEILRKRGFDFERAFQKGKGNIVNISGTENRTTIEYYLLEEKLISLSQREADTLYLNAIKWGNFRMMKLALNVYKANPNVADRDGPNAAMRIIFTYDYNGHRKEKIRDYLEQHYRLVPNYNHPSVMKNLFLYRSLDQIQEYIQLGKLEIEHLSRNSNWVNPTIKELIKERNWKKNWKEKIIFILDTFGNHGSYGPITANEAFLYYMGDKNIPLDFIQLLIDKNYIFPGYRGQYSSLIESASNKHNLETIKFLMQNGAELSQDLMERTSNFLYSSTNLNKLKDTIIFLHECGLSYENLNINQYTVPIIIDLFKERQHIPQLVSAILSSFSRNFSNNKSCYVELWQFLEHLESKMDQTQFEKYNLPLVLKNLRQIYQVSVKGFKLQL